MASVPPPSNVTQPPQLAPASSAPLPTTSDSASPLVTPPPPVSPPLPWVTPLSPVSTLPSLIVSPAPSISTPPPSNLSRQSFGLIAGIVGGSVIGAAVVLSLVVVIFRRRYRHRSIHLNYDPSLSPPVIPQQARPSRQPNNNPAMSPKNPPLSPVPLPAVVDGLFKYEDLVSGTNKFAQSNLLGQGRFGLVYIGKVSGKDVVIRQLNLGSRPWDRELRIEVEVFRRVQHKNLVSLNGYCIHEDQRFLVYEYVPNRTLDFHLHGSDRPTLDWLRRWKIAVGSAKGLAYLHEDCDPKIIHQDIKAANILLHYNFEPKVADFGLMKFVPPTPIHFAQVCYYAINNGYRAPEYPNTGKFTDRSDVFSYGVVLLELITGRKPVIDDSGMKQILVDWAKPLLSQAIKESVYDELIDPRLESNYDQYDMTRLIHCAAAAVRYSSKIRPRMSQIVRYLEQEISLEDLNAGMCCNDLNWSSND